ncbi:MAG: phosphoribosylamine--glycine ligase [Treponema sp.]|nr:phosphoribosylamine--glycine ligase [Treponema sp.]
MKVIVVGSGGREHALIWKLAQSKKVEKIYAAPGNGGTADEEKTENLSLDGASPTTEKGQKILLEFARKEGIDLTIVGPEQPQAEGIVDRFRQAGLGIVGHGKKEAMLETSKVYSKSFMTKYGIRTAKSRNFTDLDKALEQVQKHFANAQKARPLVIKADGLAAGKGVVIAADAAEAKLCLDAFMKKGTLGEAGKSVVLEEYLEGLEISVMAAVSVRPGKKGVIKPFIPARDHKHRFEGGRGPNTGGMGSIAPVPDFKPALQKDFVNSILLPTLKGMEKEKMDCRGFIFFGLMIVEDSCYLLEYNMRLGDPETQALLPLMHSDLAELCLAIHDGNLGNFTILWKQAAVCSVVLAAEGYPAASRKGDAIAINRMAFAKTGAKLFAAGAGRGSGGHLGSGLRTEGGRVLAISAMGSDADDAWQKAYRALRFVGFEGMVYRKDIGREKEWKEDG